MVGEAHPSVGADHFNFRPPWLRTTLAPVGRVVTFKGEEVVMVMAGTHLAILKAIGEISPSLRPSSKISSLLKWVTLAKGSSRKVVSNLGIAAVPQ
jgi:hypothetical protein